MENTARYTSLGTGWTGPDRPEDSSNLSRPLVIRLVLRFFAYFLLAAAFAMAVTDATRSFDAEKLVVTPCARAAAALLSMPPGALETLVKEHIPKFLWDPVSLTLFGLPAALVLAAIAIILFRLARQRPQRLGYLTP